MRLKARSLAAPAVLATFLALTGVARAASSPTLTITGASAITADSARLTATVNPNGSATSDHFAYGPTTALGTTTATQTAGAGTKARGISVTVKGLQSGTTYFYDVVAENAVGTVTTRTVRFKTTGPPPAQATTGGAQVLGPRTATLTGVINPENAATAYYFKIGDGSAAYTLETVPQTVPAGSAPVPVAVTVTGLAPGVVFHYALVATHGGVNTGQGADASFETFPDPVPAPRVTQRTSPRTARRGPYQLITRGEVHNTTRSPDSFACTGVVTVAFYHGRHRVFRQLAPLTASCGFSAVTHFARLPTAHHRREQLLVYVRFDGNGYLRAVSLRPETITLG
jgi:hypothetical protein